MNIIIEPEGINDNVMDEVLKTLCALSSSLSIQGPVVELGSICREALSLEEILAEAGGKPSHPRFISRSLVYDLGEKKILVIKFLKAGENLFSLLREVFWMKHLEKLQKKGYFKGIRFDIPQPLEFSGSYVVKIRNIPVRISEKLLHPENYALCFIASEDYFLYPNEILPERRLSVSEFKEVILRASYLFGYLTSLGIIHTDIIPLFHNRPERRGYHYWEGGRLDRWLFSCDYPNFGITGIRDFEHFNSWDRDPRPLGYGDNSGLSHIVGMQLLSFLLVSGSYFRNKDPERLGFDKEGNFVDARDLFDKSFF